MATKKPAKSKVPEFGYAMLDSAGRVTDIFYGSLGELLERSDHGEKVAKYQLVSVGVIETTFVENK